MHYAVYCVVCSVYTVRVLCSVYTHFFMLKYWKIYNKKIKYFQSSVFSLDTSQPESNPSQQFGVDEDQTLLFPGYPDVPRAGTDSQVQDGEHLALGSQDGTFAQDSQDGTFAPGSQDGTFAPVSQDGTFAPGSDGTFAPGSDGTFAPGSQDGTFAPVLQDGTFARGSDETFALGAKKSISDKETY